MNSQIASANYHSHAPEAHRLRLYSVNVEGFLCIDEHHFGRCLPSSMMVGPARDICNTARWVVFGLDDNCYALPLDRVERIVQAVHVTSLPRAPNIVLGMIDVQGRLLPVFNIRRRFGLPERKVSPTDHFLIAHTARRGVVLVIDAALGVFEYAATAVTEAVNIADDLEHIDGAMQLEHKLVLIHNLERLLSPDEAHVLDRAMMQKARHDD